MTRSVFLPPESFVGWELPGVIEPTRCRELIEQLEARGFAATGTDYPGDYRNNDRLVYDDPELATSLLERVRARLPEALEIEGERWELDGLNTRFRACRYRGGQSFCIHRDGPYAPSSARRSQLTLQLYLDEDPGRLGGHTRFYADPRGATRLASIAPRSGSAIVFDHRAWHDGEAVTNGVKHVLRTDVMYRRAGGTEVAVSADPRVLYRHRGYAWHVIACRDGSIASAGRDGTVRRWRGAPPGLYASVELGVGSVTRLVAARDGRIWCGTRTGALYVLDGLAVSEAASTGAAILDLAARPDGGVIAATSKGELVALERNGSVAWTRRAHDGWAWAITPDRDGYLSCGEGGALVALDDTGRLTELARLPVPLRALASSTETIFVGDTRGVVHAIDRQGTIRRSVATHSGAITALQVLADGRIASAGEDGEVRIADERVLRASDFVTALVWVTNRTGESSLVVSSYDGAIYRTEPLGHGEREVH